MVNQDVVEAEERVREEGDLIWAEVKRFLPPPPPKPGTGAFISQRPCNDESYTAEARLLVVNQSEVLGWQ